MTIIKRYDVRFDGTITTETPFHTSPPGAKGKKGDPLWLPRSHIGSGGRFNTVPVIPSSGIRGRLRRSAFKLVNDAFMEKEANPEARSPFALQDFYLNGLGGFAVKNDGSLPKLKDRERNPITSLFGAAYRWGSSRLYLGHAYPSDPAGAPVDIVDGVRRDDLEHGSNAEADFEFGASVYEEFRIHKEKAAKDTALVNRIAALQAEKSKSKAKPKSKEAQAFDDQIDALKAERAKTRTLSAQMMWSGFEAMAQGATLNHSMSLIGATAVEIGLFIETLRYWSNRPYLGAKSALGLGLVRGSWSIDLRETKPWRKISEGSVLEVGGKRGDFECPDVFDPFVKAWDEYLAQAVVEDFRPSEMFANAVGDEDDDTSAEDNPEVGQKE